jgi:hypothetical protein
MQLSLSEDILLKVEDPENTFFNFICILFPIRLLADFLTIAKVLYA